MSNSLHVEQFQQRKNNFLSKISLTAITSALLLSDFPKNLHGVLKKNYLQTSHISFLYQNI